MLNRKDKDFLVDVIFVGVQFPPVHCGGQMYCQKQNKFKSYMFPTTKSNSYMFPTAKSNSHMFPAKGQMQ